MAQIDFDKFTRQKQAPYQSQAFAYGTTLNFPLPRVGLLQGIYITLRGTTNVLTGAANIFGYCSLVDLVRVTLNSTGDLDNFSGVGYHYLARPNLDNTFDPHPTPPFVTSSGRSAIASGQTFAVDFYVPVAPNIRDATALVMLQNEATLATVLVTCAAQSTVAATTLTFTGTPSVTVTPVWFTLPAAQENMPDDTLLHGIIEERSSITGTGDTAYVWPRGDIYLQMLHGVTDNTALRSTNTFGAGGPAPTSDGFSQVIVKTNTTDTIYQFDVPGLDNYVGTHIGQARLPGTIPLNFMASAGLGMYDKPRDTIDSANFTDLRTVITTTISAGTIYHLRRLLIPIGGG